MIERDQRGPAPPPTHRSPRRATDGRRQTDRLVAAPATAPTSGEEASDEQTETPPPPAKSITLNTQQNAIPVALLAPLVPGVAALNDVATFTGVVTWHANAADVAGSIWGRLDGVDLAIALPKNSPHILTGTAAVELTDCRWQGEQFQRLAGTLTTNDAAANGSLLIAARAYLGCRSAMR